MAAYCFVMKAHLLTMLLLSCVAFATENNNIINNNNNRNHVTTTVPSDSTTATTTTMKRHREVSPQKFKLEDHLEVFKNAEFEFGRQQQQQQDQPGASESVDRLLEEVMDMEDADRALFEVDLSLSTSMSIVLPFPTAEPTGRPTVNITPTAPPSESPTESFEPSESLEPSILTASERLVAGPCEGDPTRTTTLALEVELASETATGEYATNLEAIITRVLASSFPICESIVRSRRDRERRALNGDQTLHLGDISVNDTGDGCEAQNGSSTTCRQAQCTVEEYGGTGNEGIADLIRFNLAENEDLTAELANNGILAVRVINDNNVDESNEEILRSSVSNGEKMTAGTTAAVAVVGSLTAVTLIGVFLRRKAGLRRSGMAYMEAPDDYDCKSMEDASHSQRTFDETLPYGISVEQAGILGAMSRDSLSDGAPGSPQSTLRKRPYSP